MTFFARPCLPRREWELRIRDIIESIQAIFSYTRDMDFDSFSKDRKTVDAIIRNFTVIGEAANHVPFEVTDRFQAIPWQDIRDMRNILVHEYFGVGDRIFWDTIHEDLPPLLPLLNELLDPS